MPRTRYWLMPLGLSLVLAVLSGCPLSQLMVEPGSAAFGTSTATINLRVHNTGSGVLSWEARENIPWLLMAKVEAPGKQVASTLTGTVKSDVDVIQLTVLRELLPLDVPDRISRGEIVFTSNGGEQIVPVSAMAQGIPVLQVTPESLDFGAAQTEAQLQISNTGLETLNWTITLPAGAAWLSVTPASGELAVGSVPAQITVRATRAGLTGGSHEVTITVASDGGNRQIPVRIDVPPFTVLPTLLDFGGLESGSTQIVNITNGATVPTAVSLEALTDSGGSWLGVTPQLATLPGSGLVQATVSVNPAGLTPASYTGRIRVTATATGYSLEVPVSMAVTGFTVSPGLLDFGTITASASNTFSLQNLGPQSINWSVSVPASAADWLSLNKTSGTLVTADSVQVTVNPLAVDPGTRQASLVFVFGASQRTVVVRMTRPRPAALTVEPSTIDFGMTGVEQLIGIWNDGIGTVNWRIDTAGFPAWLTLTPTDANGIASGTVAGAQTDAVTVRVDRSAAPQDEYEFNYSFVVEAQGDSTVPTTVGIHMSIPKLPKMILEGEGVNEANIAYVNLDTNETKSAFYIRNEGASELFWSIDLTKAPSWLTSLSPSQGSLAAGIQQTVTVTVDRTGLSYVGAQHELTVVSNDPAHASVPLLVEVQVPKVVVVGATPRSLAFGLYANSDTLGVANFGDPDTIMNFRVTSTKEWLSVFPETGASVGVVGDIKDWQAVSVSIDRTKLDGEGASAKLVITAFEIKNGQQVPLENVDPLEVNVSVQAASLTIETGLPRLRIPSLLRFVLMMRNIQYQILPIPESLLGSVGSQFAVFEKNIQLDLTETNQFLTSANRLRGNVMILLDYSGSMQAAAHQLTDDFLTNKPDWLQAVYENAIAKLIDELPMNYEVGLAIFNERGANGMRVIRENDTAPVFSADRALLQARLKSIVVHDNGATMLLPALEFAARELAQEDLAQNLIPFDDADVRGIICVTDGNMTTPPGIVTDTISVLLANNTRAFFVGWGSKVVADPLVRIANGTGGHYYSTRNAPTGETDPFGTPLRVPVYSELENWCATDAGNECDQSIAKDLKSQVVFSYVTLNEEDSITVEGRLTFNDPNDQNSGCLADQGDITGSFSVSQLNLSSIAGDPRLGQIALISKGIQADHTAEVIVRADYIPRNIGRLQFRILPDSLDPIRMTVSQVSETEGGIISDWTRTVSGDDYAFTTAGDVLQYGEFGALLRLRFDNVTQPFLVYFSVLDPVWAGNNPNVKYFTCPDTLRVDLDAFLASSFPSPFIGTDPAPINTSPITVDLGINLDVAQISVFNLGGHHAQTGVWLNWEATLGPDSKFLILDPQDSWGTAVDNYVGSTFPVSVDRTGAPGDYEGSLLLHYTFGSVNYEFDGNPIYIRYTVLPPELTISATDLDFGDLLTDLPVTIQNSGQGILGWTIGISGFPSWLKVSSSLGNLRPGESETIYVSVSRADIAPGIYQHTFMLTCDNQESRVMNVTMTQP